MNPNGEIDDETIEALVRGEGSQGALLSPLVAFARQVQEIGEGAPPAPSAELLSLIESDEALLIDLSQVDGSARSVELASAAAPVAGPLAAAEQARQTREGRGASSEHDEAPRHLRRPAGWRARPGHMLARLTQLGTGYQAVAATVVAAALVTTAGLVEIAPRPVNKAVKSTVSSITPFDVSTPADEGEGARDRPEVDPEPGREVGDPTGDEAERRGSDTGEDPPEDAVEEAPETEEADDPPVETGGDSVEDVLDPEEPLEVPDAGELPPATIPDSSDPPLQVPELDLEIPFFPSPDDNSGDDDSDGWWGG